MEHELMAGLIGFCLGASGVMLLWMRDLARRARQRQLDDNQWQMVNRRLALAEDAAEKWAWAAEKGQREHIGRVIATLPPEDEPVDDEPELVIDEKYPHPNPTRDSMFALLRHEAMARGEIGGEFGRPAYIDDEPEPEPERFECRGCGAEMTEESAIIFDGLCRGCEREREAENAADARAER